MTVDLGKIMAGVEADRPPPFDLIKVATVFVRNRLDSDPGAFGHFIVDALLAGLPLRICGSTAATDMRKDDWSSYENYLDLFAAYAAYFGSRMARPYKLIPDFPRYDRSYVGTLNHGSKAAVVRALVAAMERSGRAVTRFAKPRGRKRHGAANLTRVPPDQRRLTTLSMGGGRDSIALGLILANYDDPWLVRNFPKAARQAKRYRHNHLDLDVLATFADTGSEYEFTYDVIDRFVKYLATSRHPYEMITLKKPVDRWGKPITALEIMTAARGPSLVPGSRGEGERREAQWWSHGIPGETAFAAAARGKYHLRPPLWAEHIFSGSITARSSASCTMNHKVEVMRRFRQDLTAERIGFVEPWRQAGRSCDWVPYEQAIAAGQVGRHRTLIGIHAGERYRTDLRTKSGGWPTRIVNLDTCDWGDEKGSYRPRRNYQGACYGGTVEEFHYPLVDWNIGELEEDKILTYYGFGDVRKSGCMHCHWAARDYHWANMTRYPVAFEETVAEELGMLRRRWTDKDMGTKALVGKRSFTERALARALGQRGLQKLKAAAKGRRIEPAVLAREVARGRLPMIRPETLASSRGAILPCEVAYHAIWFPEADVDEIFSRGYDRGGGAT